MPEPVELYLKPIATAGDRLVPNEQLLKNEYATHLLEKIGASKTQNNVDMILKNLPIEKSLVAPVWARGSMLIFPGCKDYRESDKNELIERMFKPKESDETHKQRKKMHTQEPINLMNTSEKKVHLKAEKKKPKDITAQPGVVQQTTQHGRRVSWSTVYTLDANTRTLSQLDMQNEQFRHLLDPPMIGEEDIGTSINIFCATLTDYSPRIKQDLTGKLFTSIKRLLTSSLSIRFYGLLCHYCYWNIVHPWARNMIQSASVAAKLGACHATKGDMDQEHDDCDDDDNENLSCASPVSFTSLLDDVSVSSDTSLIGRDKEALFVQMEECLIELHKMMGFGDADLATAHQCQVAACHYVVDEILTMAFSWLNPKASEELRLRQKIADDASESTDTKEIENTSEIAKQTALRLRRLMHQSLADILDPSRIFTQHMLISSYVGEHKSITPKNASAKYYITSMAVRAVFGDAYSDQTRRFMRNSNEPYVPVPGVARVGNVTVPPPRDEFKITKPKLPVLSSSNSCSSTLIESPSQKQAKKVLSESAIAPPSTLFSSHKSLGFGNRKNEGDENVLKAIIKNSQSTRQLLASRAAAELASSLTKEWESTNPLIDEAIRAEKEAKERQAAEDKVMIELEKQRARAQPVDFYNLFGYSSSLPKSNSHTSSSFHKSHAQSGQNIIGRKDNSQDDLRSMIENSKAAIEVSIIGKGRLMGLVADRAAAQYSHIKSDPRPNLLLKPY